MLSGNLHRDIYRGLNGSDQHGEITCKCRVKDKKGRFSTAGNEGKKRISFLPKKSKKVKKADF